MGGSSIIVRNRETRVEGGDYTQFCTTHIERAMCLEVEQNQKVDMKKTLGLLGC